MANRSDYVELGLTCTNVCKALHREIDGKELDNLSRSVYEAIEQLTTWVKQAMYPLDSPLTNYALYHRTVTEIRDGIAEKGRWN